MPFIEEIRDHIDNALFTLRGCWAANDNLQPQEEAEAQKLQIADGSIIVNGVVIPRLVADQLRLLGESLTSYSIGELEDAVEACAFDCSLIDDDDGVDFEDSLHYTERKKEEDDGEIEPDPTRRNKMRVHGPAIYAPHFCDRIELQRKKKCLPGDDDDDATLSC